MQRHPDNSNLSLHYGNMYEVFPVQESKGPFISQYLSRLYHTLRNALGQYSRVFAFRIDLRLPADIELSDSAYTNEAIGRFIESFKAKIKHNRHKARRVNPNAHDSNVRFVWAREQGQHGKPHHHMVILLNYDAFSALGKYEVGRDNMFNRLVEAWASALGLPVEAVSGLVEIPNNPYYCLRRGDLAEQGKFFYRASYLCKSATKVFGEGHHGFGASRI